MLSEFASPGSSSTDRRNGTSPRQNRGQGSQPNGDNSQVEESQGFAVVSETAAEFFGDEARNGLAAEGQEGNHFNDAHARGEAAQDCGQGSQPNGDNSQAAQGEAARGEAAQDQS